MFLLKAFMEQQVNVSSHYPNKNYCCNKQIYMNTIANKFLFKLPSNLNKMLKNCDIESAKLYFHANLFFGYNICFSISKNQSDYNYKTVTFHNCPKSVSRLMVPWSYDCKTSLVKIDITNALSDLLYEESQNNGYQICVHGNFLNIRLFSDQTKYSPYLEISLNQSIHIPCKTSQKNHSYIDIQIKNPAHSMVEIENNEVVPFNNTTMQHNIYLCKEDSSVVITEPGVYHVYWQLHLSGSIGIATAKLSLTHCNQILSTIYTPSSMGQINGHSLIQVTRQEAAKGYQLELKNTSTDDLGDNKSGQIFLKPVDIPASMIIFSIS